MNSLRILTKGGLLSFRALFNWAHPSIYIPTLLLAPVLQIIFFTYLGRFSRFADDTYFVVGNAVQASAVAGLFGMVMAVANEREFGTLSAILATPANRMALFLGRAFPVIAHGLIVSAFGFTAAFLLLDLRVPLSAVPALAATVVIAATSATMFGLAVGSIGVRTRDLWVGSNLAYYLLLLLCGTVVPLSSLPSWLAAIGRAMPLTHGIQAARELATGAGLSDVWGLLGWEAVIGLAYGVLGYALLRFFEAESRRRASLDLR